MTTFSSIFHCSHSCLYESPGKRNAHTVERTRDWRAQTKCARDAGLPSIMEKMSLPWFQCHICGACIGPNFYTQHLYLYPVFNQYVSNHRKKQPEWWDIGVLRICDTCAQHKSRNLPDGLCVISPSCWMTTELLEDDPVYTNPSNLEQSIEVRLAVMQYVELCEKCLICILFLAKHCSCSLWGIMLRWIFTSLIAYEERATLISRIGNIARKVRFSSDVSPLCAFTQIEDPGFLSFSV